MGVNRYICQTVGGRNNGEPVTGSRPAQVHWCMHAVKAGLCGPIKQASYYSSNAPKLMLVLIERCQNTKWITLCLLHMRLHSCRTVRVPMLTPFNHDKLLVGSTVWSAQKPDESVWLTVLPALWAITSLFDQTPVKTYHWYIYLTALWITGLCLWASQCLGSSFFGLMCITIRLLVDFTDRRNVYTVI